MFNLDKILILVMIPFKDVIGGDIICVNTPSTHGSVGLTTGVPPSMTLGCGTPGGNITSDNITPLHLINTKRLAFEIRTIDQIQFQLSDEPVAASTNRVKQTTVRDELEEHVSNVRGSVRDVVDQFFKQKTLSVQDVQKCFI